MTAAAQLVGRRFERLVVIARVESDRHGNARWLCLCDCGGKSTPSTSNLMGGSAKSCGCRLVEARVRNGKASARHGHAPKRKPSLTYKSWLSMKNRCFKPDCNGYKNYGGRGITICDRWLRSFEDFLADMGERPPKNHSIERKDNDGHYEPSNCYWATAQEQARNKRKRPGCTSRFKGVSWCKSKKAWKAAIRLHGVVYFLGYFKTEEDAHAAYVKKDQELHGDLGRTK